MAVAVSSVASVEYDHCWPTPALCWPHAVQWFQKQQLTSCGGSSSGEVEPLSGVDIAWCTSQGAFYGKVA